MSEDRFSADGLVHDKERLKELQALPLYRKVGITTARIVEWYKYWDGKVFVSFSGGKDSTVLLDIARKIYPDIEAVFIDTGLEYPEVRENVRKWDNVTWLKPEMSFRKVIETYGYPVISKNISRAIHDVKKFGDNCWGARCFDGRETGLYNMQKWKFLINSPFKISNSCCDVMKKKPAKKYDKETGKHPIIGTMACESQQRRSIWLKYGCNTFEGKKAASKPMSFWTEQDVLQYIKQFNLEIPTIYGDIEVDKKGKLYCTGANRTGCMFCMFGCHLEKNPNRFQQMKLTHPQQYDYCIRPWDEGGLGLGEVLDYIGVNYK